MAIPLDIQFVRQHFPALTGPSLGNGIFFDSAAGSFPCQETIDAINEFYLYNKVQPGNAFGMSQSAFEKMQTSKQRWAEALNVRPNEVGFGPSTSQNTYVLAQAFRELLEPGDEVIVTDQDHEANTGAIRRAVVESGASLKEWHVEPDTGLLSMDEFRLLINDSTRLVCFPHSSNITGQKNDAAGIIEMAHAHDAWTLVDGVSYVPHDIPDISLLGADIYVFSLYKVFSVHQGVLVIRQALLETLPKQGHYFKHELDVNELFVPAGPDHAQIGSAGAVLDYIETLAAHHGGPVTELRGAVKFVSKLWQDHEQKLTAPLLDFLSSAQSVRLIGSSIADEFRCPLVSFAPQVDTTEDLSHILCDQDMLLSHGHFYAPRLLEAMGIDSARGVIRISMAHYNAESDVKALINRLEPLL